MPRILPVMALRQRRLDQATGIGHMTRRVEYALAAYKWRRQRQATRFGEAAFWHGVLSDRRTRLQRLRALAEAAPGSAPALLAQAEQWQADIVAAEAALEKLT